MRNLGVAGALAAIAIVLLAGCTPGSALPDQVAFGSPLPTPSKTTSPVITPTLPDSPTLRYALTCDELVPERFLSATFGGEDIGPVPPPVDILSPRGAGIRQHGGMSCAWGNGEEQYTGPEPGHGNPAYKNLAVHLLPDPDRKWDRYATAGYPQDAVDEQFGSGSGTACFVHQSDSIDLRTCSVNVLIGRTWVDLMFEGIDVPVGTTDAQLRDKMRPVISGIVERIPDPRPAGSDAVDVTVPPCAVALPIQEVLDVLELPTDTAAEHKIHGSGGYDLRKAAREYSGAQQCTVGPPQSDLTYVSAATLPGGAWAFHPAEAERGIGKGSDTVDVPRTSADSYLHCVVSPTDQCWLDMAVGDDWVRVSLSDDLVGTDEQQLLSMGALIAENLG